MNQQTTAVTTTQDKGLMEYVPFGGEDKIKLTVAIVRNMIAVPSRGGKLPSDTDCIKFQALCKSRRLNPFEGDCFLIGYDTNDGPKFSLITAHQAFLKRAELHPEYDGMKSGLILKNEDGTITECEGDFYLPGQEPLGAWATVFFKTRKVPMYKRVRLASFSKGYGRWKEDPAGMIVKCAEADALRSSFPTMLGGLYLKQEADQGAIELPHVPVATEPTDSPSAPDQTASGVTTENPGVPATSGPLTTAQPPASGAGAPGTSPQSKLAEAITSAGYSFDDYLLAVRASKLLPVDVEFDGFEQVPVETAKRHLRVVVNIINTIKGGAL